MARDSGRAAGQVGGVEGAGATMLVRGEDETLQEHPAVLAAINHAVKAGACWSALRVQPWRAVWGYMARAHSREAGLVLDRVERAPAGEDDR